ncbi:hypothetical protein AURDEDRAFT_131115, partial [Auricularia subglabra TFB-10046 SS5]
MPLQSSLADMLRSPSYATQSPSPGFPVTMPSPYDSDWAASTSPIGREPSSGPIRSSPCGSCGSGPHSLKPCADRKSTPYPLKIPRRSPAPDGVPELMLESPDSPRSDMADVGSPRPSLAPVRRE